MKILYTCKKDTLFYIDDEEPGLENYIIVRHGGEEIAIPYDDLMEYFAHLWKSKIT